MRNPNIDTEKKNLIKTLNEEGYSNSAIARKLHIPIRTVQRELNNKLFSVKAWRNDRDAIVCIDEERYTYPGDWKIERCIIHALKKSGKILITVYNS